VFDNDGTLWCEKPNYTQLDFLVRTLRSTAEQTPELADREEYRAVLAGDCSALATMGLERVAMALVELFDGLTPAQFENLVREFVFEERHPEKGSTYAEMVYSPMIELLAGLRECQFDCFIVTGGGTEFVRAVSEQLYGVKPERVVGTLVDYRYAVEGDTPTLHRTSTVSGLVNEGMAKVSQIQMSLGRRPIFAAGNSRGDLEMLEYARTADGPSLALLVDHDDADREYAYDSHAATVAETSPLLDIARTSGWLVVSMRSDWSVVFAG
jgi:phosphoserine phosphatase